MRTLAPFLLFAAVTAALGPPASVAAPAPGSGAELVVADVAGDTSAQAGGPPVPWSNTADAVDITEVRLHGETGESLRLTLAVKDVKAEKNYPILVSQGVDYGVCFKLGDTTFAASLNFVYGARASIPPKVGIATGCTATGITYGKTSGALTSYIDPVDSKVQFVLPRRTLALVAGSAPPAAGAPVSGLFAFARDHRGARFDAAGPGSEATSLTYPTANLDLRMFPDVNVQPLPCGQNRDLPTYAIEAGGKRGIPVTVSNLDTSARMVTFNARTTAGPDWNAKIMPGIEVPAGEDAKHPGNITVNVIVDTPAGTKHRDCSTILVRAIDSTDPAIVGETSVNVVAAIAPSKDRNTLYLHADSAAENVCSGEHIWMNVDAADPNALKEKEILLNSCEETVPLSLSNSAVNFFLDVNPNRDLILNTTAAGKVAQATLVVRADGAPTQAKFTASLISVRESGIDQLGEGSKTASLTTQPATIQIPVPIAFTREFVATGDPSRVVSSTSNLALSIRYEPLPADSTLSEIRPAGLVYVRPEGSTLTLPVWSTVKRNTNDPGASGALLGLKVLSQPEAFANPGKVRVFNFTVLNEGATTDVAVVSTLVDAAKPWNVQVVPPGPFKLDAGRHQEFTVGVTPPSDAAESESSRVEVAVSSQSDPTARSAATVQVTATSGQDLREDVLEAPLASGKKGLPGPSTALVALALLGAALALRRP